MAMIDDPSWTVFDPMYDYYELFGVILILLGKQLSMRKSPRSLGFILYCFPLSFILVQHLYSF